MKLKTTLSASNGTRSVAITVESVATKFDLTRYEQEKYHEQSVNAAHGTLLANFNVRQIKVR